MASDIGAAALPKVFFEQVNGTTNSTTLTEVASFTPPSGRSIFPLFVWARITTAVAAPDATGKIRFTLDNAATIDTAVSGAASFASPQIYFASWGFSTFADNGDAWNAVVSGDNLFTRLDDAINGRTITKIAIFAASATAANASGQLDVGGFFA